MANFGGGQPEGEVRPPPTLTPTKHSSQIGRTSCFWEGWVDHHQNYPPKLYLYPKLVLVFLLINNIGHCYDLFSERESSYLRIVKGNGPEFNNKADYIDSACDFTYIEFYLNLNDVEKQTKTSQKRPT